jgi:hypothetical protein
MVVSCYLHDGTHTGASFCEGNFLFQIDTLQSHSFCFLNSTIVAGYLAEIHSREWGLWFAMSYWGKKRNVTLSHHCLSGLRVWTAEGSTMITMITWVLYLSNRWPGSISCSLTCDYSLVSLKKEIGYHLLTHGLCPPALSPRVLLVVLLLKASWESSYHPSWEQKWTFLFSPWEADWGDRAIKPQVLVALGRGENVWACLC